jgi:hypothetical protein
VIAAPVLWPAAAAVMFALPVATPVTSPDDDVVAMEVLELVQVTVLPETTLPATSVSVAAS